MLFLHRHSLVEDEKLFRSAVVSFMEDIPIEICFQVFGLAIGQTSFCTDMMTSPPLFLFLAPEIVAIWVERHVCQFSFGSATTSASFRRLLAPLENKSISKERSVGV